MRAGKSENMTLQEYLLKSESFGARCLRKSGITSVDQIVKMTKRELIRASDPRVCKAIIEELSMMGLSLRNTEIEQRLNLPDSVCSALADNGIETIQELTQVTEEHLLGSSGIGQTRLKIIKRALKGAGLEFSKAKAISLAEEYGIYDCPDFSLKILDLTYGACKCLSRANVNSVRELLEKTRSELRGAQGMRKSWVKDICNAIEERIPEILKSNRECDNIDLMCSVQDRTIEIDAFLEELDLPVRAYNCLKRSNINTVEELLEKTEAELLRINNLGDRTLQDIKNVLGRYGFILKSDSVELKKEVKRQHRVAAKKQLTLAEETLTKGVKQLKKALQMLEAVPEINSEIDLAKIELLIRELESMQ